MPKFLFLADVQCFMADVTIEAKHLYNCEFTVTADREETARKLVNRVATNDINWHTREYLANKASNAVDWHKITTGFVEYIKLLNVRMRVQVT